VLNSQVMKLKLLNSQVTKVSMETTYVPRCPSDKMSHGSEVSKAKKDEVRVDMCVEEEGVLPGQCLGAASPSPRYMSSVHLEHCLRSYMWRREHFYS
jgi:hypothetical protein